MRRFGQVIKIKQGCLEKYKEYHANPWPEVLKRIEESHIKNYSIYLHEEMLFAYFEYHGDNFEADMQRMGEHKKMQEWWAIMEPMQSPYPQRQIGEWWMNLKEVFHTD